MIVDVGPLGCSFSCGHGHADLLSIQCSAFGEPVLVDAGTYCYTPEPEWRNFFRGTAAHSTVMIDGRDQVETDGPFGWRGTSARRTCASGARKPSATSSMPATTRYDGITHRRRVLFVKPDYWVVVDDVDRRPQGRHDEYRPRSSDRSRISVCADVCVGRATIDGRGRRRRAAIRSGSGRSRPAAMTASRRSRRAGADSRMGLDRLRPADTGAAAGLLGQRAAAMAQHHVADAAARRFVVCTGRLGAVRRPQSADRPRARGSTRIDLRRRLGHL